MPPAKRAPKAPKVKGLANWCPESTAVRASPPPTAPTGTIRFSVDILMLAAPPWFLSTSHLTVLICAPDSMCSLLPQAAVGAKLEADERWSASSKTYRQQVTCEVFGTKMKDICGATGTEGPHPFVVKKRLPRDGGDWDMKACVDGGPDEDGRRHIQAGR